MAEDAPKSRLVRKQRRSQRMEIIMTKIVTIVFRVSVHYLGLAQRRFRRTYGPGPGAPVGVYNMGILYPDLCTDSSSLLAR